MTKKITVTGVNLSDEYINEQKRVFMKVAKQVEGFVVDDRNRKVILNLFNYFNGIPGELDPDKGLWLEGDIGTGKTSLIRICAEYMKLRFNGFKIYDCTKVSNDYAFTADLDLYTFNTRGFFKEPVWMCFDDLGHEIIPARHFGQELNVMQHILHIRYAFWQETRLKTFITTNLDRNDVGKDEYYGKYIQDRCGEMFNIITMTGQSRRK